MGACIPRHTTVIHNTHRAVLIISPLTLYPLNKRPTVAGTE